MTSPPSEAGHDLEEWARRYSEKLKLPVFPCRVLGKEPATERGFKDATTDPERIHEWWSREDGNIGIPVPEGHVVLDVDSQDALNSIKAEDLELPATVTAKTPRGWHFWYRGDNFKPGVGIFPGVDIRAPGSYVVVPPSRLPNGKVYTWKTAPENGNIAPAPEWLYEAVKVPKAAENGNGRVNPRHVLHGVAEGTRDVELFRYACRMREYNYDREEAEVLVLTAARACEPPFPEDQALKKLEQAWKYPTDRIRKEPEVPYLDFAGLKEEFGGELPRCIVPKLGWQGGVTLIAAEEKSGKSTLLGQAITAVCHGWMFLDQPCRPGRVVLLTEEHGARVLHRLERLSPNGLDNFYVVLADRYVDPLKAFEQACQELQPDLGVIDTLRCAMGGVESENSSSDMHPITTQIERITRQTDQATLVLHHSKKNGQGYRGSSEIGAAVDVIAEMRGPDEGQLPTDRNFKVRGRFPVMPFTVSFDGKIYSLSDMQDNPLRAQVLAQVVEAQDDGITKAEIKKATTGRHADILDALEDLQLEGVITGKKEGKTHRYHLRTQEGGNGSGTVAGTQ